MSKIAKNHKKATRSDLGVAMLEMALLIALLAIIAIPALQTVGQQVNSATERAKSELSSGTDAWHPTPGCNLTQHNAGFC